MKILNYLRVRLNMKRSNASLIAIFSLIIIGAGVAEFFTSAKTDSKAENERTYQDYFNRDYKIYSLNLPQNLSFAGEEVPLQLSDVSEKLDRELHVNTYWQSNTLLYLKRSNKWFPVIEPILKENDVPEDFKYLALIESGLTQVVSPAGATGFWQFMEGSGREYGLEINDEVDERYHVEKATKAACDYLKEAKEKFGTWTLAAASYNMGQNGLEHQLERQKASNYYDLLLNTETARYVFRILAAKEILNHPGKYGFHYRDEHLWEPIKTEIVKVDTSVDDFAAFAKDRGINYKVLKNLNPWLRQSYLRNRSGKTYEIKLPQKSALSKLMLDTNKRG